VAAAGSTPRCWYYMLRYIDPDANRYRAIVIPVESYDDAETIEDYSVRESDLNYLIARLRLTDLFEFSFSYPRPDFRWRAFRGILFKGLVYKWDLEDFVLEPKKRIDDVLLSRRDSWLWFYEYVGTAENMSGVQVDWEHRTLTAPPDRSEEQKKAYVRRFLDPLPKDEGRMSAYMRKWLGKVYEHYRGSTTRLIFLRLPRGPFIRPDLPPPNPHSSIHELEARPEVMLMPEDHFNVLERPELFRDDVHLNQPACEEFSRMLARQTRAMLGPPF
jgi:hypothetical protein